MLGDAMRTDVILGRRDDLVPAALLRLASDQRLVEQVRAGSERAFEALFDRHHRPVLAFCRHMLGSKEEAEDVVQLTFLAAYRDLGHAEAPAALRPWLYAIARHRCLSVLRARRERPVAEVTLPGTDRLAAEVSTRDDLRAILADVAQLPDDQRAALVLAELGDVSHEEIARILACPREKVKALVFQARSSLVATRVARETPCADIREQLANLRGGALRRTTLRRHLRDCSSCSAFREQVRVQRRALGLLLPVAPGVGLRRMVLDTVFGSGAGGAGGAALTAAALNSGGLAAAALVILAIPAGGVTVAVSALGGHGAAPHATPTALPAATANAWPRPRAEQAAFARDRPGSPVLGGHAGERRLRTVHTGGDAKGAHQARPTSSSGQEEPARPQVAVAAEPVAVAAEPLTAHGPATPETAPHSDKPPQANGEPPATHGKPSRPPQANGQPPATAGRPPQANGQPAATPGKPPQANAHPPPAAPAKPSTPPQAGRPPTPAAPNGRAVGPPPAAGDAAAQPAIAARPSPPVAATLGGSASR
jgi:RNA polymerase sigma factor (sigma-70 family)